MECNEDYCLLCKVKFHHGFTVNNKKLKIFFFSIIFLNIMTLLLINKVLGI